MKDQIHNLVVTDSLSCFVSQGTGVKVLLNYEYMFLFEWC